MKKEEQTYLNLATVLFGFRYPTESRFLISQCPASDVGFEGFEVHLMYQGCEYHRFTAESWDQIMSTGIKDLKRRIHECLKCHQL